MARLKKRAARLVADLRPALEGCVEPISFGVGWDDAIYIAAHRSTEPRTIDPGGSFPKSRYDAPTDYIVHRLENGTSRSVTVPGVSTAVTYVQPYLDGVLLAGARCRWRPEGPEQNAFAVDWSGKEVARFVIGDGVNDLRVTPTGKLWASYFDEGVHGNYGWNDPGPRPMGASGLVRFSANGTIELEYDRKAANTDAITDTYAMNVVSENDVWVCFYTEFPIVRVVDGAYHVWKYGVGGVHAFAISDGRALLFGDYKNRALGRTVELKPDRSTLITEQFVYTDNDGAPLDNARSCGVRDKLYFLQDRRVFVLEDW